MYRNEGMTVERIKYGIIAMWAKVHGIAAIAAMKGVTKDFEWEDVLEQYKIAKNTKMVKRFEECPIRESAEAYHTYFTSMLRDTAMHELGVGTTRDMKSVITGIFFPTLRCTVYSPKERINIWRGKAFAQNSQVAQESRNFNAFEEIKKIEIPIYFFAGKYDYTCCYSLQKEYYEQIQAPIKEFYTFENSAHSPLFEESEKGMEMLYKIKDVAF